MTTLAFGVQLPVQAQSRIMADEWEHGAGPAEIMEVAQAADSNGYDYVGVCDHVAIPRDLAPRMTTTWYDTVSTLSWLAGITRRVRLASTVLVVAYRHPLVTAKAFSTLDALSGGRAVLGVGAGHVADEFAALGVPFAERGRLTNDAIVAIRAAFGDEWGAGDLGQAPRPVQPGGPPIWVGGSTPPALRRAARLGDGWLPQGPPPQGMAAAIRQIRDDRDAAGRDGPFAMGGMTRIYLGEATWETGPCISGSSDEVAAAVAEQAGWGVTHLQVKFPARSVGELTEQMAGFAEEVVPRL
ncbi:MAG: TIGR03619 family F420-dependent LLM class oxidoreductase [Acidobacteriota bacterium]|nr:TIGR03619 family F420-dependent LLM class oxidoreductase [Acidobacteriota bacterium]